MSVKMISKAVIGRLPRYYRYLGELIENGVERISSEDLSRMMSVTASQIRQDLNNFGGFGQQGYGYNVKYLYGEIAKILGVEKTHNVVVVGAGNLGHAICKYQGFIKRGFNMLGIFDVNPQLIGKSVGELTIMPLDELKAFINEENVDIVALTTPKDAVSNVVSICEEAGIKAIWNFTPVDLKTSSGIMVENVHLSDSLLTLSYNLKNSRNDRLE